MIVTVTVKYGPIDDIERRRIAVLASRIIEVSASRPIELDGPLPYMPNEGKTSFWTLDQGNDWKIKFSDEFTANFEIIHRYQLHDVDRRGEYNAVNEAVKSLAGLLAYRLRGSVNITY